MLFKITGFVPDNDDIDKSNLIQSNYPPISLQCVECCHLEASDAAADLVPAASARCVEHNPSHCRWSESRLAAEGNLVCTSATAELQRSNGNAPSLLK